MHIIRTFIISIVFSVKTLTAQSGDGSYSIVIYDNATGYSNCKFQQSSYRVLACKVDYLSNDYLQTSWHPDLKTLQVTDTLTCATNTDTLLPFTTYYSGKSYLNTTLLLIIKNNKDTMFLDGACLNLVADYYGSQQNLPAIIPFEKGLAKLFKLQGEDSYRFLQNITYSKFWLAGDLNKPVYNPWIKRISKFDLNKERYYQQNDTLILKVTGSITSDGSCSDGNILWILQKKEGTKWHSVKEHMIQMDCGRGRNKFENMQLPLLLITNKIHPIANSYLPQIILTSGIYRIVIFDDLHLPYFSETIEI